jgi:hypothetical protein
MSKYSTIYNIQLVDLTTIMNRIEEKQYTGKAVTIVDLGDQYALREPGGFLISYVQKSPNGILNHQNEPS